jgi:SAM-dependent methyltransferase
MGDTVKPQESSEEIMDENLEQTIQTMRADWNQRATLDAYYYVAFARREQSEGDFQESAADVVADLEFELHRLRGVPAQGGPCRALDIGCGPGRLMIPLSRHFDEIHGVDISEEMIRRARERLSACPNARVFVNNGYDLALFENDYFAFVYSYVVFQHIPSQEVIRSYLREIQRVLTPGGIARFQLRGASPSEASRGESETWSGCVFGDDDVLEFVRASSMELVALQGAGTQYLWVTLRKSRPPVLTAVTSPAGTASVPGAGPASVISLWIGDAPDNCDLTTLMACVQGQNVRGAYLSPVSPEKFCQMNVALPRDLPAGPVEVALIYRGTVARETRQIVVERTTLQPKVVFVCDAVDHTMHNQSASRALKVLIENVELPNQVAFLVAGVAVEHVDLTCIDQGLNRYLYSFGLPAGIASGFQTLTVVSQGREAYTAAIAVT